MDYVLFYVVGSDNLGTLGQSCEEFVELANNFGNVRAEEVSHHFESLLLNCATLGGTQIGGNPRGKFVVVGAGRLEDHTLGARLLVEC